MAGISLIVVLLSLCLPATMGGSTVKVIPNEIDDLLANPGMGWQTFHHFADEVKNLEGLPSASAYFRFYWRDIEPAEGQIDFYKWTDKLIKLGFDGPVCVEYCGAGDPHVAAEQDRLYLDKILAWIG